jgi:hypothetical protein
MIQKNIEELLHIYNETLYEGTSWMDVSPSYANVEPRTVLVLHQELDLLPEHSLLLSNILKACKLDENDYQIQAVKAQSWLHYVHHGRVETVIIFGIEIHNQVFHLQKELYKPFRFAGKKWLFADSVAAIHSNPSLKSSLWTNGLKPLFGI